MTNIGESFLGEIDGPAVIRGVAGCESLRSSASLGLFPIVSEASDMMMPLQGPIISSSLIQRSLSAGSADSCACTLCHQVFSSASARVSHVQLIHAGHKPFECTTCGKCFANSSYLSQHSRIHLGVKPYRCQLCDRRFTQLCHLQQHIRTHTGEKPYRCRHPGCAKAFSQLSNLQSHMRSHMTDKPFRCNSCYRCFGDERSLQEHIPKHNETKHLKTKICTICGKSYAQETYLARHMAKHASTRELRQSLTRQLSDSAADGTVAPYFPQDFGPRFVPHDLARNAPRVLPSFLDFRAGCASGMAPFVIDSAKYPDDVTEVKSFVTPQGSRSE